MATVHARIEQMRQTARNILTSAVAINDAITKTDAEANALGPDVYSSPGADQFRENYQRLTPRLRQAYDDLTRFQKQLQDAADEIEIASGTTS